MVVCGNKTYSLGLLNSLLDSIRSEGFTPYVFHGSLPDAPVETVRSGVAYAKEHDVSAIVAFGGGSAMDTAKAIACMLDVDGDIIAYCKGQIKPIRRSNLLFAIPTTCGTGSESTDIGVVLDREANYKSYFANPFAGPDVAIFGSRTADCAFSLHDRSHSHGCIFPTVQKHIPAKPPML